MQKREMQYSKSWCACWASWAGHRIQWQCTITCASIFLELTLLLIDLYWKLTLLHCYIVTDQLILKPLLHCQWSTFIKYIVTLLHTLSLINFHQNSGGEGSRKKEQRRTRFYDRFNPHNHHYRSHHHHQNHHHHYQAYSHHGSTYVLW